MRNIDSIPPEEIELLCESAVRQFGVGFTEDRIKSNIEDQFIDSASAKQIVEMAYSRYLSQAAQQKAKQERLSIEEVLKPLPGGLLGLIAGVSVWSAISIFSKQSVFFIVIFISIIIGIGVYEPVKRKRLIIYRVFSGGFVILGVFVYKLAVFSYFNLILTSSPLAESFSGSAFWAGSVVDAIWLVIALAIATVAVPRNYIAYDSGGSFFLKNRE